MGTPLDLAIEKPVFRGHGLARHLGQVVLVPRGVPGERVRASVTRVDRGYLTACVDAVLETAPARRESPCPLFDHCGGCAYLHVRYEDQLRFKEAILRESLARAGAPWEGAVTLHPSPEDAWRTRASLHVGQDAEGELRLGLHEPSRHRVVDLVSCRQLTPELQRIQRALLEGLRAHPVRRRVRLVHICQAIGGSDAVAVLEGELTAADAASLRGLDAGVPWLTGLGALPVTGRFVGVSGSPYARNSVRGVELRSHALAFFQGNRYLVDELTATVRALVEPQGRVLDLYAGVGLFALALAPDSESVDAVEADALAVADARANAVTAGATNVRVRSGDVLETLSELPGSEGERVVLDPPRAGAGPKTVAAVVRRKPSIVVYVSCDPPTLGRDLAEFGRRGYRPVALHLFDLFPGTFHVETVAVLRAC